MFYMTLCIKERYSADYEFVRYVEKRVCVDRLSPAAVCGEIKRNRPCKTVVSKTTMYRYISQGIFMGIRSEYLPVGQRKKQYCKTVRNVRRKGRALNAVPSIFFRAMTSDIGKWIVLSGGKIPATCFWC